MGIAASVAGRVSALSAAVSGDGMLIPHLHKALPVDCLLSNEQFEEINERLIKNDISFIVLPQTRYKEQPGEQKTLFASAFSNNPVVFKSFTNEEKIFS